MKENRAVVELNLEDILPNRFQPRIKFDEKAIIELSESIKEHGVIQPIIVRKIGDKYEIIAGERRYKASVMAGKVSIPAIIVELNDKDSSEIALIENVQRQDLTPIEEAISYRKILDMGYLTQEELATKLGVAQPTIANKLRLLNLDEEVQDALLEERISERHARSLLKLSKSSMQREMLKRIITERLTVRKTDEEIDKMMKEKDNSSVFDSIENNMMNNNLNNNVQENTVTSSNPFDLTNQMNNNFETNNLMNSSVTLNEQINNMQDSVVQTDFNNINSVPMNSFDMENNMNNDIEVIDFNDFNLDDYNIPTVPIVEDVNEVENQINDEETIESSFNVPTFENNEEIKQDITPIEPNFNIEENNVSNEINNDETQLENESTVPTTIEENLENEEESEPELKPGRFFNLFNTYNDEENIEEPTEEREEFQSNPFGLNNTNQDNSFNVNNPVNEVEEVQNNMNIFNQELINNEAKFNEPSLDQNQENIEENISTLDNSQNTINNFDYNSQPIQPVYDEPISTPNVVEENIEINKEYTLKDVINMVRNCANDIEKLDFEIDCEEFDFDDIYQVIFKINKK